jgi:hypothetical protein
MCVEYMNYAVSVTFVTVSPTQLTQNMGLNGAFNEKQKWVVGFSTEGDASVPTLHPHPAHPYAVYLNTPHPKSGSQGESCHAE